MPQKFNSPHSIGEFYEGNFVCSITSNLSVHNQHKAPPPLSCCPAAHVSNKYCLIVGWSLGFCTGYPLHFGLNSKSFTNRSHKGEGWWIHTSLSWHFLFCSMTWPPPVINRGSTNITLSSWNHYGKIQWPRKRINRIHRGVCLEALKRNINGT